MAAFSDGLEDLHATVARGRTAAFSCPSHRQTACRRTVAAALVVGRVSVR